MHADKAGLRSEGFRALRRQMADRLFRNASYAAIDAMREMVALTEQYVLDVIASDYPTTTLWAGGSLGRREMLPNSALDLFLIDQTNHQTPEPIRIEGFDRLEVGHVSLDELGRILNSTLVDANQFVDGRPIPSGSSGARATDLIVLANTHDRQTANLISEYF